MGGCVCKIIKVDYLKSKVFSTAITYDVHFLVSGSLAYSPDWSLNTFHTGNVCRLEGLRWFSSMDDITRSLKAVGVENTWDLESLMLEYQMREL